VAALGVLVGLGDVLMKSNALLGLLVYAVTLTLAIFWTRWRLRR
jgi:hypothetical protein